ncbi:uncharacterized protein (TIGR03790 family) [Roseateles toxinivorans]|uniref:Uncharacterized protein (TIGR03790 family) n=2 Tax=Roseateles toxinivorans TaxID=270368 RepID=A0A4R6QJY5_9BURK|nr:uncharacterized protein (TIGR03790 family) [Roseateles toxinivorans]
MSPNLLMRLYLCLCACLAALLGAPTAAMAQAAASAPAAAASAVVNQPQRRWMAVPRVSGRLTARDLGLVINTADPYSVAVGEYYIDKRGIPPEQVLRLELPVKPVLSATEFELLAAQVREHMGPQVQALAMAWNQPWAVECNSITSALTLGFQPDACKQTCSPNRPSGYFNGASSRPYTELGLRPSMLLATRSVESAKALIDRGVASDGQLGRRGGPPAKAVFISTQDRARNVRSVLFPPEGLISARGIEVDLRQASETTQLRRVILMQTGVSRVDVLDNLQWLPGALADHLTSYGGQLLGSHGQMSVLDWLESGATASFGTVSEPCNHLQKFPHPQVLLLHYLQGETALEAYWKSVAWPAQGVFVGEPLAAPFAR